MTFREKEMTGNLDLPGASPGTERGGGSAGSSWAWAVLTAVRVALFFVLFWMRFVIVPVCHFVSGALFLMLLFALLAWPDKTLMLWSFGIASFAAFVIAWAYDSLLALLSPEDMVRIL